MHDNKKIKNATPVDFDSIHFKSTIERTIYKALIEQGITPQYEDFTYTLSPRQRPKNALYYARRKEKGKFKLSLDMSPISPITYTPDFIFTLNDILVIIEVKGFINDVFPVKRNLFRKFLEYYNESPVMYFEVRSKKELLRALDIVKTETPQIQRIRSLIPKLFEKDIPICYKYLEKRDFVNLQQIVDSSIRKIEKDRMKEEQRYVEMDLDSLYILQSELTTLTIHEDIT